MRKRIWKTMIAFGLAVLLITPSYSYAAAKAETMRDGNALKIENNSEIEIKKQLENSVTEFKSVEDTSMEKIDEETFEFKNEKPVSLENSFRNSRSAVAVAYGSTQGYLNGTEAYEIYGLEIEP